MRRDFLKSCLDRTIELDTKYLQPPDRLEIDQLGPLVL